MSFGDIRLGQGRERSREFLDENTEVRENLRNKILEALGVVPAAPAAEAEAKAEAVKPPVRETAPRASAGSRGNGAKTQKAR